jgi:D-psicose/D-tagatose/L-ribulose 3-epimerase
LKIGVSFFAWTARFTSTHLSILPSLREHGLDGFEIPMFDPGELPVAEIRRAAEANGLDCSVCAILPAGINPISPDAEVRKSSLRHLIRCVETTAEVGGKLLGGPLFAPIGYLPWHRRTDEEWKWAVEAFQRVGEILEANDLTLSIEPVNRSETFFLRTAEDAKSLCEDVGNPHIGVTIDTFHANIEEQSIPQAVLSLGTRLKHMHASENDRGLLGSGHVDFTAIVAALRQIGYDGYLMIEGFGYSAEETNSPGFLWANVDLSPEEMAFQGARYLRGLLNR